MKKLVENQLMGMIRVLSLSWDPCNRFIINFTGGASFVLFIYGIIILSTQPVNTS